MANIEECEFIWKNGELIPWESATTHVLSHSLHYGSAVFEGIRAYKDPDSEKRSVFRLKDHMDRLVRSCKIAKIDLTFTSDELVQATLDTVSANKMDSCYIRPLVYRGYGTMGIDPRGATTDVIIACWAWGTYLGEEALKNGIKMGTSSWRQRSANALPPAVKATASYFNSLLAKLEATEHGYEEAVMLNEVGQVCEGTGENIFIVRDGKLITPSLSSGILAGITRDSIIQIAREIGVEVCEETLLRSDLYIADEMFLTGSAAELTPVTEVDGIKIGDGKPGELTLKLHDAFFDVLYGNNAAHKDWNFEFSI